MEGIWSLRLGLFRLEWAQFLAQVRGAMLGVFLEGLNLWEIFSTRCPSIAPGTWARNRAHSKRNRPKSSDHIPSIVSCLAPDASPAQESVRWGGHEPARQELISTARRYPPGARKTQAGPWGYPTVSALRAQGPKIGQLEDALLGGS